MKQYIVYQMIITDKCGRDVSMEMIVRNVSANNHYEAIGKFVKGTVDVEAIEKLVPLCTPLDILATID